MKFNLKKIMRNAWTMAGNAVAIHGGKKTEYFVECLKAEWALAKQMEKASENAQNNKKATRIEKTTNEITAIKDWFVRKNFTREEAYVIETNDWIEVIEETAKAFRVKVHNADLGNITAWVPKSCTVA